MATVPTARGDAIAASELGFTLPVELLVQDSPEMAMNWPDMTWAARPEEERIADVIQILQNAKDNGVDTIVDRSIPGINRDIKRTKLIAGKTPVNILVLTGWYTRYEFEYYFHYRERFQDLFAGEPTFEDFMVRDIEQGILDSGVHAAAIKAVSDLHGIHETADVRNVFRHSARAHRRTGVPIMTHTSGYDAAIVQQEVLLEDGVDQARVILAHMDRTPQDVPLGDFERLLQRGANLSFDGWWGTNEPHPVRSFAATREQNMDRVVFLLERGYEKQLFLSNGSVAFTDCLPATFTGEYAPYTQLQLDIIPALRGRGVTEDQIRRMTVDNVRELFERCAQGPY
jgi:phosphotriesterase-related protein